MTTALGDECITKKLFSDELGSASKPINTAYITNIVPPPGGTSNLQDVLDAGNSATQDILLDGKYQLGTLPLNPDGEIDAVANGIGTDLVIKNKSNSTGTSINGLTIRADGTFFARTAVINTDADEVRIGKFLDANPVGNESVNIGENCGENAGLRGVHIGWKAGQTAGTRSVAIGDEAGNNNIGTRAVAIGQKSMENGGSPDAICIGSQSGQTSAGQSSIAIGRSAGQTQLDDNCIVLNASGLNRSTTSTGKFYVDPIDSVPLEQNISSSLFWNSGSKEVFVDRPRYDIFGISGGAGSTTNIASPIPASIVYARWTTAAGTWVINLPSTGSLRVGTSLIIKNGGLLVGQDLEVRPAAGNFIDGGTNPIILLCAPQTSIGGGGRCTEIVVRDTSNWMVIRNYNGNY